MRPSLIKLPPSQHQYLLSQAAARNTDHNARVDVGCSRAPWVELENVVPPSRHVLESCTRDEGTRLMRGSPHGLSALSLLQAGVLADQSGDSPSLRRRGEGRRSPQLECAAVHATPPGVAALWGKSLVFRLSWVLLLVTTTAAASQAWQDGCQRARLPARPTQSRGTLGTPRPCQLLRTLAAHWNGVIERMIPVRHAPAWPKLGTRLNLMPDTCRSLAIRSPPDSKFTEPDQQT
jgi:hypothetical protein